MPVGRLLRFLDDNDVKYVTINHSPKFTAQEIAASAHISGQELAKTVMVKLDGKMAMAVLPASYQVDFRRLEHACAAKKVELATEEEFCDEFPGCELGAMPPFGNLYGMDVFVAESLTEDDEIAFNAGTHTELVKLSFTDFNELVHPTIVEFTAHV